jgi:ATP-binding cassette, subfamily C, type I secretion system permease/ATPase
VRRSLRALLAAAALSGAINILALTGPLYMLQIYNRVLPTGSVAVLAALTAAMLALYALSGVLDAIRLRILARIAVRFDSSLTHRVLAIVQTQPLKTPARGDGLQPLRDLDQLRAFLAGPGPTALFDMPWLPLYLAVIYVMHPLLGALATASAAALVVTMLVAERRSVAAAKPVAHASGTRWAFAAAAHRDAEAIAAMGMRSDLGRHWTHLNERHIEAQLRASRPGNTFGAAVKVARPALQSGILGLGAFLAIHGESSPGTIIAASIVFSRALAPVETALVHWRAFAGARQAHGRLATLLQMLPKGARPPPAQVPQRRSLCAARLCVAPPAKQQPTVKNVSFKLQAGAGLGIIGPNASGKSTLARALVGAWPPSTGAVHLDGVAITRQPEAARCRLIGYLPQATALIDGTIADNIARFDADASHAAIVEAARAAGAHEMITRLPAGYATAIGTGAHTLSAGQCQRIALARALFGDPFLVVLDEPDASLDSEGQQSLQNAMAAVRNRGGIIVVVAHRLATLDGIDTVLALKDGYVQALGPKESVLTDMRGRHRGREAPLKVSRA